MANDNMPVKAGQICKIISDIPDLETEDVYIVTENPAGVSGDDKISVVKLKDLQRNINNPDNVLRLPVTKNELVVVAEDLESYVRSWNN